MAIVGEIKTDNGRIYVSQVDRNNYVNIYALMQARNCISIDLDISRKLNKMLEEYEAKQAEKRKQDKEKSSSSTISS